MKLKDIKVGKHYETKLGEGKCTKVGGTFPVSVQVIIDKPIPRGLVGLAPRDVYREISTTTKT